MERELFKLSTNLLKSHDNVVLVLVKHDDGRMHIGELADAV